MKYFTREEVEYHIRKNYNIEENDNFLPYILDKADKEGLDEAFFKENEPLYEKMAFFRILNSASPSSYHTKDNDYYEEKAVSIFLLILCSLFTILIYAALQQSFVFLSIWGFSLFCFAIPLFIPLRFTSHYARKTFMTNYFYFLTENIKDPLSTEDFRAFCNSYGPQETLNAIRYTLFFKNGKGMTHIPLSSFIDYASSKNSKMYITRSYLPGIQKRVDKEMPAELEEKAKSMFDEKVADLNK